MELSAQVMPIAVSMEIAAQIFTKNAREAPEKLPITMATTVLVPLVPSLAVENSLLGSPAAWQRAWLAGVPIVFLPQPLIVICTGRYTSSCKQRVAFNLRQLEIQLHSLREKGS